MKKGGGEYGRLFKQGYAAALKYGVSVALGMEGASQKSALAQTAHEHAALYIRSKKSIDKYDKVYKAMNRAFERKQAGEVVPKAWLGPEEAAKIEGETGFIPRRMMFRNPQGYHSGRG